MVDSGRVGLRRVGSEVSRDPFLDLAAQPVVATRIESFCDKDRIGERIHVAWWCVLEADARIRGQAESKVNAQLVEQELHVRRRADGKTPDLQPAVGGQAQEHMLTGPKDQRPVLGNEVLGCLRHVEDVGVWKDYPEADHAAHGSCFALLVLHVRRSGQGRWAGRVSQRYRLQALRMSRRSVMIAWATPRTLR